MQKNYTKIMWVDFVWIIFIIISIANHTGNDYIIYYNAIMNMTKGLTPWNQFGYYYACGFLFFIPFLFNQWVWFGLVAGCSWWTFRQLSKDFPIWMVILLMILESNDLSIGNCNGILLAIVVYWYFHPKTFISGLLIGIGCFKPNYIILILPFIIIQNKQINWTMIVSVTTGLILNYLPIMLWIGLSTYLKDCWVYFCNTQYFTFFLLTFFGYNYVWSNGLWIIEGLNVIRKQKRVYQSIPKIKYILGTYLFENTKYTTQIIRTS